MHCVSDVVVGFEILNTKVTKRIKTRKLEKKITGVSKVRV
jgi:hypothetical protein